MTDNSRISRLVRKFQTRDAHVAVIGLGYVGLPLALTFAQAGYRVTGIDVDQQKVDAINCGRSYIGDVTDEELSRYVNSSKAPRSVVGEPSAHASDLQGSLAATMDFSILAHCDAVSICVPTPLNKTGDPDMSYILSATENVAKYLHADMVIVLESTTYPGTTTEVLLPALQAKSLNNEPAVGNAGPKSRSLSLQVGVDFFLAFSPERVDPGRTDWVTRNTPKVIGGVSPSCLELAMAYYGQAIETLVPVSSPDAAEMVKLFENTFRAVNIALANELLLMCDKLNLDAWEVIEAAATKPFGFMKFTPGPGLGGHCIPIDPQYLSWKLRTLEYNARFIELASKINTDMPRFWAQQVQDALNDIGKPVKESNILVLGVAYKKDVGDLRESPALDILHLLHRKGAHVHYHDPYVPSFRLEELEMQRVPNLNQAVAAADCVIITTDHGTYNWNDIQTHAQLLVDTRHVLQHS